MALDFNTSHQYSLPVRWGDILAGINEANTFSATTVATRANNLSADFLTVAQQGSVIDGLYSQATNVQGDLGDWSGYLSGLVQATLQAMCAADSARPRTDDLSGWFDKLNRDMAAVTTKWEAPVVTATLTAGANVGNGYLIASVVEPADGQPCYFGYGEILRLECSADSYSGGATVGAETFAVYGETAVDKTDPLWPKGSGANTSLTAVNVDTEADLTDGGLEAWTLVTGTTRTLDDWSVTVATVAGTHLNREGTTILPDGGSFSAKFTGDGSAVIGMYQVLDQTVVKSSTNYAVSFWYQTTSNTYTAKLRVALVDSTGTPVTDNAGASQNSTSAGAAYQVTGAGYTVSAGGIDETALGAANGAWARGTVVLRTPRSLPSGLRLEFRFPTGDELDNAKSVYVDHVVMSEMEQVYDGGPYLAVHAGATAFALKDSFACTVGQTAGTTSFVRCLDRAFDLAANGIRLVAGTAYGTTTYTTVTNGLIA